MAAAARGCRFVSRQPHKVVSEPYQRFPKTEGRIVSRKQRTRRSGERLKREQRVAAENFFLADSLSRFQDPKLEPSMAGGRLKF